MPDKLVLERYYVGWWMRLAKESSERSTITCAEANRRDAMLRLSLAGAQLDVGRLWGSRIVVDNGC
jgi:hypothetical protein